ncbi:MAG: penicillin-binding protein activator LpoB [Zoogloeaceae bacterium]|nr:penicillin-binding protein activator LpoB [Zoogloeaceae bacterium]
MMLCLLCGCATREEPAFYVNEMGEVSIADGGLTSELQLVAGAMTHAMMPTVLSGKNMPYPSRWAAGVKPLAIIVETDNQTEEFVDSRLVTNAIRTALRSHGALRVLDDELPFPDARQSVPGTNTGDRVSPLPPSSSEPDVSLPSHEADGAAPVGIPLPMSPPKTIGLFESNAQKRERLLRLLEARSEEQDVQGRAPAYAIRTVLLPFAPRPFDEERKDKKETYLFKMLVEDVRSETIKWVGAREVRKAPVSPETARKTVAAPPLRQSPGEAPNRARVPR